MKVVGLDLSLTAIGIADERGTGVISHKIRSNATDEDRCERLHSLASQVDVATRGCDLVVIEGYAFGRPNQAHQLGELGGLVKTVLWRRGRKFFLMPPAKVKKFATNNGGAAKEQVLAAAVRMASEIETTHEADAYFLRMMALGHYLNGDVIAPAYRAAVLQGIDWPVIRLVGEKEEAVG